eukprot:TRINITY_DN12862_c0_g1_i1.p1 TRINITY_DN12862_c0_g1~~TRINITY_DN12862_c0_g1_i1.p1  ORF type:complete len:1150 (+),score=338.69 TRINITY_DN12862_c0_g1_i1:336-3785(+)
MEDVADDQDFGDSEVEDFGDSEEDEDEDNDDDEDEEEDEDEDEDEDSEEEDDEDEDDDSEAAQQRKAARKAAREEAKARAKAEKLQAKERAAAAKLKDKEEKEAAKAAAMKDKARAPQASGRRAGESEGDANAKAAAEAEIAAKAEAEAKAAAEAEAAAKAVAERKAAKAAKAAKKRAAAAKKKELAAKKAAERAAKAKKAEEQRLAREIAERNKAEASAAAAAKAAAAAAAENAEDSEGDPAATAGVAGKSAKRGSGAGKGGKYDDSEGTRCVQTIDMGLAIRSAICVGKEVWTVDWQGNVTIRERDNAAKVKAAIPASRFVLSMMIVEPGLILMGQESQGIAVFGIRQRDNKGNLTGGHTGNVSCLALGETFNEDLEEEGFFPPRCFWSGSNDFTIRVWNVQTWKRSVRAPSEANSAFVADMGKVKVSIAKGASLYGHKNGVRCLLRIGPILWSGSDDSSIRLWHTVDCNCTEIVEDAHKGSVLRFAVVRSFVWSCGADGLIKEWTIGGTARQCVRQIAPEGCDKGVYSLAPMGNEVWTCGHHPSIQVFSQKDATKLNEHHAHEPYISALLPVDRVETKIVWSTSLGDRKLKVWRNTIRGEVASFDEMKAANKLFEEEQQLQSGRISKYVDRNAELEKELNISEEEFKKGLEALAKSLATSQAELDELEARKRYLQDELDGIKKLFEDAGLGRLMEDPEAMRDFLQRAADLEQVLKDAGLGHLLDDPEGLKQMLQTVQDVQDMLQKAGFGDIFNDPAKLAELKTALETMEKLREMLEAAGIGDVFKDPKKLQELQKMLESAKRLKDTLAQYGFGDAFDDPSVLAEVLSRYNEMKKLFDEYGMSDLFEDPLCLKHFLRNYAKMKEVFEEKGLEHLLHSYVSMRNFLNQHSQGQDELKEVRERASKLEDVEEKLRTRDEELSRALADNKALRERLAEYEKIGSLEEMRKWKGEAKEYDIIRKRQAVMNLDLEEARRLLEEKERERLEALERERMMAMKYKELDIFKLDIIARELKALDNELGFVGKEVKMLQQDAGRLKNYDEQQQIGGHGGKMIDQCVQLRAHIRDVINKCLSETQKLHIGAAIDDPGAAGELEHGGVMAGYVVEEVDVPEHGSSRAARLRQDDEVARERHGRRPGSSARTRSPNHRQ